MAVDETKQDYKGPSRRGEKSKNGTITRVPKEDHWQYPPYFTVDDLCNYRKHGPHVSLAKDNLKLGVGSFKNLKTEYQRRFKNFYELLKAVNGRQCSDFTVNAIKPENSLKLGLRDFQSEYNEAFNKDPIERLTNPRQHIIESDQTEPEMSTRAVAALEEPTKLLAKRNVYNNSTTLKPDGDYSYLSEYRENFIEYLIAKRAELLRTPTNLKMAGDMETKTESSEQFIKYDNIERPALCKKFTQLHMEGDLDTSTQNSRTFAPLELSKRPPLEKKFTNLHLEGDQDFTGEYAKQFVDYKSFERCKPTLPHNNLKTGDLFESDSNELKLFDTKFHSTIPFLREPYPKKEHEGLRTPSRSPSRRSVLKQADNMQPAGLPSRVYSHPNLIITRASNSTLASGTYDTDFDRHAEKRFDSLPSRSRRRQTEMDYLTGDGKMDVRPEYSSSYVDFPRERPRTRKPEGQIANEGEVQYVTEKADKYTPHRHVEKIEPCRREPELKLEGRLECQPEYRKAYIDYLTREKKPPMVQRRRAYDLLNGTQKADASPNGIISSSDTADNINITTTSSTSRPKSKLQLPESFPSEISTSSAPSSPKAPRRGRRSSRSQIAHFEDTAFGPTIPTRRSQTPSPAPDSRRGSRSRRESRHSSPRGKSGFKPAPTQDSFPRATRWSGTAEGDTAFFILDKAENRRNIRNSLYKEQKWMPSWNYST